MFGVIDHANPPALLGRPQVFQKTWADAGDTPDFIFDTERIFSNIQFGAFKGDGDQEADWNTGNIEIWIRGEDGTYQFSRTLEPGVVVNWIPDEKGIPFSLRSFKIKTASDDDGVRVIYS